MWLAGRVGGDGAFAHTSNGALGVRGTRCTHLTVLLCSIARAERVSEDQSRVPFLRGPVARIHQITIHDSRRARLRPRADTWSKVRLWLRRH